MNTLTTEENKIMTDLKDALEHGMLVSTLAYNLAKELGNDEDFCYEMAVAGMLHDIGKLKLSKYLYGRMDDVLKVEEIKYVRMHSTFSYEILQEYDYSDTILKSVYHHHENYDGSGYPSNLKSSDIPYGARILRTCDVFAALVSDRPYRAAFDIDTAIELMIDEVKNFDMEIFLAFTRVVYYEDFKRLVKFDIEEYIHKMQGESFVG